MTTALAGTVVMDGTTLRALSDDPGVVERALGHVVSHRAVRVASADDGARRVTAVWTVQVWGAREHVFALATGAVHTESVRVDGDERRIAANGDAVEVVLGSGMHTVTWVGTFAPGESIRLMPGSTGSVSLDGVPGRIADAVQVAGQAWTGAAVLTVEPRPVPVADTTTLATADVGVGLTLSEGHADVRARVRFAVRRGEVNAVRLRVPRSGSDLHVSGPGVATWERQGEVLIIGLTDALTDGTDIALSWSEPVSGSVSVPVIEPLDVFRVRSSLQVARPDDLGLVPTLPGWRSVARSQVPAFGVGLVDGAPRLSYVAGGGARGSLTVERFEPIPGPPVIVDVADWRMATTAEGRALLRGFLEVRNERASHLRVTPPPGFRLLTAQVGGESVAPVQQADAWLVPLDRSLETVEGLLSFPVELALLGDGARWDRVEMREVAMPVIDAPVQASRATVVLPPAYADRDEADEGYRVDAFSESGGIAYGFGVGDVGAAEADARFQAAVDAWMVNDFDKAQQSLDALRAMGAESANIGRLQSNLDAVTGRSDDVDPTALRRVREQAKARAVDQERAYAETQRLASEAEQRGDYQSSSAYYEAALGLGQNLSLLEGDEVEVATSNAVIAAEIDRVAERRQALEDVSRESGRWAGIPESDALPWEVSSESPFQVEGTPWWLDVGDGETLSISGSGIGAAGYGAGAGSFGSVVVPGAKVRQTSSTVMSFEDAAVSSRRRGGLFSRRSRDGLPAPDVRAASASMTVPVLGEPIRFERLLLPPDTPFILSIHARARRSP